MAARLIQVRAALGMSRQVFYVSAGAYDTHNNQVDDQQWNLSQLSQALKAFHEATIELAIDQSWPAYRFGFRALAGVMSMAPITAGVASLCRRRCCARTALLRRNAFVARYADPDDTVLARSSRPRQSTIRRDTGQWFASATLKSPTSSVAGALCHGRSGFLSLSAACNAASRSGRDSGAARSLREVSARTAVPYASRKGRSASAIKKISTRKAVRLLPVACLIDPIDGDFRFPGVLPLPT